MPGSKNEQKCIKRVEQTGQTNQNYIYTQHLPHNQGRLICHSDVGSGVGPVHHIHPVAHHGSNK